MRPYVSGEDTTPPTRSVTRVDWFLREPGGGTVFIKPGADLDAITQPAGDCADQLKAPGSPDVASEAAAGGSRDRW